MIKSEIDRATSFEKRFEQANTVIFESSEIASKAAAAKIAELIREKQKTGQMCVLGLATGSSPKRLYAELVRLHKEDGLSFRNVITFNLEEYYSMETDAILSYVRLIK